MCQTNRFLFIDFTLSIDYLCFRLFVLVMVLLAWLGLTNPVYALTPVANNSGFDKTSVSFYEGKTYPYTEEPIIQHLIVSAAPNDKAAKMQKLADLNDLLFSGVEVRDRLIVSKAEQYDRPVTDLAGDRYTFLTTSAETGGRVTITNFNIPPGAGPPPHIHGREDESWYVVKGEMTFFLGDRYETVKAGDLVYGPQSRPHGYTNKTDQPSQMISIALPAGLDQYLTLAGTAITDLDSPITPFNAIPGDPLFEKTVRTVKKWKNTVFIPGKDPIPADPSLRPYRIFHQDTALPTYTGSAGEEYTEVLQKAQTDQRLSITRVKIPAKAKVPTSREPISASGIYITEGKLMITTDNESVTVDPQTFVYIPPNMSRTFTNVGTTPVILGLMTFY